MSGGTPVGGGYMRQRHSQGYASGGDDIDDDARSRFNYVSPQLPTTQKWTEVVENLLWIASAVFIVYFGTGTQTSYTFSGTTEESEG